GSDVRVRGASGRVLLGGPGERHPGGGGRWPSGSPPGAPRGAASLVGGQVGAGAGRLRCRGDGRGALLVGGRLRTAWRRRAAGDARGGIQYPAGSHAVSWSGSGRVRVRAAADGGSRDRGGGRDLHVGGRLDR